MFPEKQAVTLAELDQQLADRVLNYTIRKARRWVYKGRLDQVEGLRLEDLRSRLPGGEHRPLRDAPAAKKRARKSRLLAKWGCQLRASLGCRGFRVVKPDGTPGWSSCQGGELCGVFVKATRNKEKGSLEWIRAALNVGGFRADNHWSYLNSYVPAPGTTLAEDWVLPPPPPVPENPPPEGQAAKAKVRPERRGRYTPKCPLEGACPFYPWAEYGCRGGRLCAKLTQQKLLERLAAEEAAKEAARKRAAEQKAEDAVREERARVALGELFEEAPSPEGGDSEAEPKGYGFWVEGR